MELLTWKGAINITIYGCIFAVLLEIKLCQWYSHLSLDLKILVLKQN